MEPNFSDLEPTVDVASQEVTTAQEWAIMHDADVYSTALIQDSTAYSMAVEDYENEQFDEVLMGDNAHAHGDSALHSEGEAPSYTDVTPDGKEVIVYGQPNDFAEFNHQQGDNDLGFQEDCGLCSSQDVLNQFGVQVDENDIVHHAVQNNECYTDATNPSNSGQTTADWQAQVLSDYGVPAHVENGGSLDNLADNVQAGHGTIIEVNAGVLWNDANSYGDGSSNHAITVTGVVRDPSTNEVTGFYINDSGDGKSAQYVDAATMQTAWVDAGGQSVVTDATH